MIGAIIRFIVSALVLLVVSWILPGISVNGFTGALFAAAIIALLGWVAQSLMGKNNSPQGRGIVGFISAAVVFYLAQFIVPNQLSVSIIGALLAALVIGLVDAFIPTTLR
ncbi:MAG: phage holin family protein [Clostridia bacterium]|nr:phage holin family protein [Clostridia bacterium]